MELWNLALAAVFFCAMGIFAGVAALYLTSTPFRPLGHQAAEIVLFCLLFAIALFAVIALFQTAPNARRATRPKSELPIGDFHRSLAHRASEKGGWRVTDHRVVREGEPLSRATISPAGLSAIRAMLSGPASLFENR